MRLWSPSLTAGGWGPQTGHGGLLVMIPRIRRVQIRNYKSIAAANVTLAPLTVLVGPNGAGKSNFIDALSFLQESLASSLDLAFKNRGGIAAVRRRSGGHPTHVGIRVMVELGDELEADYSFEIAAKPKERFQVARERCLIRRFLRTDHDLGFEVRDGHFTQPIQGIRPQMASDRLALYAASATDEYRPVYDFLSQMRFYSIAPQRLRELQEPDPGEFLKRDGSNAAAVLRHLQDDDPDSYGRLCRLLATVVERVKAVEYANLGQKDSLRFKQEVAGQAHPWTFEALNMSDGTLRVLGVLLAVLQRGHASLVAIEEPESTVHPAAAEVVFDVLLDASKKKQVLVTTHSPDLLDSKLLSDEEIRAVTMKSGSTQIGPVTEAGRAAIAKRLYTPGELLRLDELEPDPEQAALAEQLELFGKPLFMREDPDNA